MDFSLLLGHLHPLLVHLPIGILLLACALDWLSNIDRFRSLKDAVPISLLFGTACAFTSCISGYLLSLSSEYDSNTMGLHQWLGVITTIISFAYWQMKQQHVPKKFSLGISLLLVLSLSATGHLGGTLTHGEGYLIAGINTKEKVDFSSLEASKAFYYRDIVEPILNARCYSCHGETKQKGRLRLDRTDLILAGGKSGKILVANHPDESEMINRLLLPLEDKKHMPPREKEQPSPKEIALLKEWITFGADFKKSVNELNAVESVQKLLLTNSIIADDLNESVEAGDNNIIAKLKAEGAMVSGIAQGNNHLDVSLLNVTSIDSVVVLLPLLKNQIVRLNASNARVMDKHLSYISKLTGLRKLDLSHTKVSEELSQLSSLSNLRSLNLSFTSIRLPQFKALQGLKSVRQLYLFNCGIDKNELPELKKLFPNTDVEIGNYSVTTLASDTTLVRPPKN